jgi:hypothetical protein
VYSYEFDLLLPSDMHLALQGHGPAPDGNFVSHREVHGMCGEAFSAPCVATILVGLVANPWSRFWTADPSLPVEVLDDV